MAEIDLKVPIQVDLPDDWIEQIVNRLRNDPEAEWAEIVRCKDCKYRGGLSGCYCDIVEKMVGFDSFCSWAERRTDDQSK